MTQHSDLAVIIPVYNRAKVVLDSLESVRQQTVSPKKLIVVDDGSTDNTVNSIRNWISQHPLPFEVKLIEKTNGGVSSARNLGIDQADDCQFLAFLDSDDLWPNDFLQKLTTPLQANQKAVAITSNYIIQDAVENSSISRSLHEMGKNAAAWMFMHGGGVTSSTVFRTSHIVDLGGFDQSLPTCEDSHLYLRVALRGVWLHQPAVQAIYRHGVCESVGEHGHLSTIFTDKHLRWAEIHEDFIVNQGGAAVVPRHVYTKKLARLWQRAGADFLKNGEVQQARQCLRKSLDWRKWYYKAWYRLATTYLPQQQTTTPTRRSA